MNVFFDVLDTLLTEENLPRPHAREVFLRLKDAGHEVYLWSSGGGAYAAAAAEVLRVTDLVDGCFGKRHELEVGVDFVVDDDAALVEYYGGYRVEPFGGDPGDEELLRAAEAVDALGDGSGHALAPWLTAVPLLVGVYLMARLSLALGAPAP